MVRNGIMSMNCTVTGVTFSAGNMAILVRWTGEGWVVDMGGPESDESYGSLLDHVEP